jgi:hypothetical protein
MIIIGLDYHPGFQQIAFVDTDTGEFEERHLEHREEAEKFYRDLAAQGMKVRVGMEASSWRVVFVPHRSRCNAFRDADVLGRHRRHQAFHWGRLQHG